MIRRGDCHGKRRAWLLLALCGWLAMSACIAQTNIPIGTWRLHLSYNTIRLVEITPDKIYAVANNGILVYDRQEKSLNTYNKLTGLSGIQISSIAYDADLQQLLIGYIDGTLDIIRENTIKHFTRLRDADVTTSKTIRHISVRGPIAYLSTAFGVVTFNLDQLEIKETWRDLGASGEQRAIFRTAFARDSIYLATDNGVISGHLDDNLLDFNNWTRFNSGSLAGPITAIVNFANNIYAAGSGGVVRYTGAGWVEESFPVTSVQSISASEENLFIVSGNTIVMVNTAHQASIIRDPNISAPAEVKQDTQGALWIADQQSGLISNLSGSFNAFVPNGPSLNAAQKLTYEQGKIFMVGGGFSGAGQPRSIPGDLNWFENGSWHTERLPVTDLMDVGFQEGTMYVSTFGSGLLTRDAAGNIAYLDETNSPLVSGEAGESRVTAVASTSDGLWVANYGGNASLHLLKADGSWASHSLNASNAQYPTKLVRDKEGRIWMALNPATGGGLLTFDPGQNQTQLQTTATGSGALPHHEVYALAVDKDDYVWVGTTAGLAYFFASTEDAIKPIFENRFLLRDEKITAIAVDGGNRKWIGTEQGAWLFNPTGETLVHHFTQANSPLLSDVIRDITIHAETGEVFFATDHGVVSYRSDAEESGQAFEDIKIFPNPVHPGYTGTVGISGLSRDAQVRITDISGRLVWQTQANGGMATWYLRDHQGRKAATGVYLVFATSADGSESMVGKVAVIE